MLPYWRHIVAYLLAVPAYLLSQTALMHAIVGIFSITMHVCFTSLTPIIFMIIVFAECSKKKASATLRRKTGSGPPQAPSATGKKSIVAPLAEPAKKDEALKKEEESKNEVKKENLKKEDEKKEEPSKKNENTKKDDKDVKTKTEEKLGDEDEGGYEQCAELTPEQLKKIADATK